MKPIFITIILVAALQAVSPYSLNAQSPEQLYQKGLIREEGEGALQDAISLFNKVADNSNAGISLQAKALLHIGMCYEKLGMKEATKAYQRLVNTCPDQTELVALAKGRLAALVGSGGTRGLVTRRVLTDASGVGRDLTADGKYISKIDQGTGDVVQFEVASGQTRRITNRGSWGETEKDYDYQAFSRDGSEIGKGSKFVITLNHQAVKGENNISN